jgi:predicted dehydrogenase
LKKFKAAIIGLGVGEQHIQGYSKHPACEVVALCDFSDEKLGLMKQKYPHLRLTKNADEILEDPEIGIVSIASYDQFHKEQILKGLKNGKHLFIEKPVCLNESELEEIHAALKKAPSLKISSNLILRMCPRFRCVLDSVGSNRRFRKERSVKFFI